MFAREARRRRLLSGAALVIGLAVGVVAETGPGAAGSAAGFPDHVRRPSYFNFDRPPPAPNWRLHRCDESSAATFGHGILTIDGGCLQYQLWAPNGIWNRWVSNERGWIVEANLRVAPSSGACRFDEDAARLWIHDHTNLVIVAISPGAVCIVYPDQVAFPMDATDGFHNYRVEAKGRFVRIYVDGVLAIDHVLSWQGGGSELLFFGDGTGVGGPSLTFWDYVSYDVTPEFVAREWQGSAWPASTEVAPAAASPLD